MSEMRISEVNIIPVRPVDGLVGFASCVLNNRFYIGNMAIYTLMDGSGIRLVYPTKHLPNGKQINCFHPLNRETGEVINMAIEERYEELAKLIQEKEVVKNNVGRHRC
jgi:stage V sporulation protein G